MPPYAPLAAAPYDSTQHPADGTNAQNPSTLDRIRKTARTIEDRVRRALIPPGNAVATLRFLVVDDHPDAADALAAVLELLGCNVRACYDGWSALNVADEFDPQVCLLDLKMPGMDGLELAARLKVRAEGRPVLLVATTALGDEATRSRTTLTGFHSHLIKPVDIATLVGEVSRLWATITDYPSDANPPA